jgi:hypothetical protein
MGPTQSEEIKNISAEMARLRGALNATPQDVLARPIYNELLRLREKRREIERRLKSASESSAEVESQAQEKSRDPQGMLILTSFWLQIRLKDQQVHKRRQIRGSIRRRKRVTIRSGKVILDLTAREKPCLGFQKKPTSFDAPATFSRAFPLLLCFD